MQSRNLSLITLRKRDFGLIMQVIILLVSLVLLRLGLGCGCPLPLSAQGGQQLVAASPYSAARHVDAVIITFTYRLINAQWPNLIVYWRHYVHSNFVKHRKWLQYFFILFIFQISKNFELILQNRLMQPLFRANLALWLVSSSMFR